MAWFLRMASPSGLISRRNNAMGKHCPPTRRKGGPAVALAACAYDAMMGVGCGPRDISAGETRESNEIYNPWRAQLRPPRGAE
jgi:hypothetical protein